MTYQNKTFHWFENLSQLFVFEIIRKAGVFQKMSSNDDDQNDQSTQILEDRWFLHCIKNDWLLSFTWFLMHKHCKMVEILLHNFLSRQNRLDNIQNSGDQEF